MKLKSLVVLVMALLSFSVKAQNGFHAFSAVTIEGDTISMNQFYGKKILVVNTASYCSWTPQFEDLQTLYEDYSQYNFLILGFPCNDFGNQDPHGDSTIADFCHNNYGVTFQMMSKIVAVDDDTCDIYKWLQRGDLNGVQNASVSWNFNKFLIDEAGNWVKHYNQYTEPLDTAITNWIMSPSVLGVNEQKDTPLSVYPNPSNDVINFKLDGKIDKISIINPIGQNVATYNVNSSHYVLRWRNTMCLPVGPYFYLVTTDKGLTKSGKLILE